MNYFHISNFARRLSDIKVVYWFFITLSITPTKLLTECNNSPHKLALPFLKHTKNPFFHF